LILPYRHCSALQIPTGFLQGPMKSTISAKDHRDIQGIIVSGYRHLTHSVYLFINIDDAAKTKHWLRALVPKITTADWNVNGETQKPNTAVNFAASYEGLAALGYP